ncbi:MAG: WG repeat-containing protein, partial [Ruminococcus sp.]|nr:WG repeat-containing protein [Ruminococcus sp.]
TIDRKGNEIYKVDSEYELGTHSPTLYKNLIPVRKDNLYGFIDMLGNEVVPLKYNSISNDFINGYACVAIGENYGVINTKDENIIPFEYSSIDPFDQCGLAIAQLSGNTSERVIIDLAGNITYRTTNSLYALGGGYFREDDDIIYITADSNI